MTTVDYSTQQTLEGIKMKIRIVLALVTLNLSSYTFASTLVFEQAGFQIDSLESAPGEAISQPLMMFLPAEGGFAANVNIQIQPYTGTISDYKKLSESQFSQLGIKIIRSELKGNIVTFEYTGPMNNAMLHWYAKAVKKGNYVYLATATSLDENWTTNKTKLVSSVNSFILK